MTSFRASAIGLAVAGALATAVAPSASAAPDFAALPVDPNVITDSTAYVSEPPVFDPNGQPGVEQVFTHRDGSRQITDTILSFSSPEAALAALEANRADVATRVGEQTTTSVPVGDNGSVITGTSAGGTQAMSVLLFTRGATATEIEFQGGRNDPVPSDLVVDYGQRQDDAIQQQVTENS